MNTDSGFDDKEFTATPYLRLIEDKEGATCVCYQMRLHGKLHFVKKIKPEFEADCRMRSAFRKENEIGFSLSHPNIPRYVFMEGIFSPEEYVVTEWIDGLTLDKFIEKHPSFFSKKKNIEHFIYQLADALDYLHHNGVVHGDLKPSNIMVSNNGERTFILDLGYAVTDAHTLTGGFSPSFASPRVLEKNGPEVSDDYYSFGKILKYIQQNVGCFYLAVKKRKQIDTLLAGDDAQKKNSYSKLKNSKSGNFLLPAVIVIALAGALVGVLWGLFRDDKNNDEVTSNTYASLNDGQENQPEVEKVENARELEFQDTKGSDNRIVERASTDNNMVFPEENSPILPEPQAEVENSVKLEVGRLLDRYYMPLISKIDSLTTKGIYTKEWKDSLTRLHEIGIVRCLNIYDYEEKFPRLSREDLQNLVGDESQKFFEEKFNDKFFGYVRRAENAN